MVTMQAAHAQVLYLSLGEKAVLMLRMRPSFMAAICARMPLACRSNNSNLASWAACIAWPVPLQNT